MKCVKMRDDHTVLHLLCQSAISAVSTSVFRSPTTHPKFNFHTCKQGRRGGKLNLNCPVLFFGWRLSERLPMVDGVYSDGRAFLLLSIWGSSQRGLDGKGRQVWKS